jgi:hypothetical protein
MSFNSAPDLLIRSLRQMFRAVSRGDTDAAWRWTMIVEQQLSIMLKLADLDPDDNRLRRYRPALALMRRMVFARERSHPEPLQEAFPRDQKMERDREAEPPVNRNASSAPHATRDITA